MAEWNVWRWLGLERPVREREVLDSTLDILEHLEPDRARYVAGFAYLLGRVAGADSHVSADETALMKRLVMKEAGLSDGEAEAVVRLALDDHRRFGGTHNLIVARELAAVTTPGQRLGILRCLFAISAADASVQVVEDNEIRGITRELKIEHADFVRARLEVREHLAVLRGKGEGQR
jgi:uncharacterized tellurite resistance protein B-like protein